MAKEVSSYMARRFPDKKLAIERLCSENELFQELCEDYEMCREMLSRCETEPGNNLELIEEYRILKKDLEQEIQHLLKINNP